MLTGEVALRVGELVRQTCEAFEAFAHIKKRFWGRHVWASGYFCTTVGQMTEEMIKKYLKHHFEPGTADEFKLDAP